MIRAVVARTATVYKGGGKTYITKAGAYNRAAVALIRAKRHEACDPPEYDAYGNMETGPYTECPYCGYGSTAFLRLRKRLARWLRWRDERASP